MKKKITTTITEEPVQGKKKFLVRSTGMGIGYAGDIVTADYFRLDSFGVGLIVFANKIGEDEGDEDVVACFPALASIVTTLE